ncbi:MAG: tRNA (adenosine(37)-N6)-dimethylallyltransferase MiaA [Kiritimatiellae bacterium]|nr:tRNA (adenosine(37)-N6)-dimethylallyltransferase MiaA [Kiritimatiellia bacterium]
MTNKQRVYVLAGPTAAGKSAVIHRLALLHNLPVLSADSMAVYQGMDIGTAKPDDRARKEATYYGVNLATPNTTFSVGDFMGYLKNTVHDETLLVAGGTGLYLKCLLAGLNESPPADPVFRAEMDQLLLESGLQGLQEYARKTAPETYEQISDPANPRRIIRALEKSRHPDFGKRSGWEANGPHPLLGLRRDRAQLTARIELRVRAMYAEGLLDEAEHLLSQGEALSQTALQAIGYREAFAVLRGEMPQKEAMAQTAARSRQLAKRQMTWFNHQFDMQWIDVHNESNELELADRVWTCWQEMPPAFIHKTGN